MAKRIEIKAQPGPQEQFFLSKADIVIFGGAAGGGKSYALLVEPLRWLKEYSDNYAGVIFRRESPQITNPGGLWDESSEIYSYVDLIPNRSRLEWEHDDGFKIKFSHLQYENDKFAWQGSQLTYLGFDELTHFSITQFFYLIGRLRSKTGLPGYCRATTNPDPDSWVAQFISWWIGPEGLPIPERGGVLRYFVRINDQIIWADSAAALKEKFGDDCQPLSVTFIPSKLSDNKILMAKDPTYLAKLQALPRVERARLLDGNWKIRAEAGTFFKRGFFEVIKKSDLPPRRRKIRYWDRAATEKNESNNPDFTSGVLMSRDSRGMFYVEHVERFQGSPLKVETTISNIAHQDGKDTIIGFEVDPGAAGKFEADYYVRKFAGFTVKLNPANEDKVTRAGPLSSQCENGYVKVVQGSWNDVFFIELENFPTKDEKDDQVDSCTGAFKLLTAGLSGEMWDIDSDETNSNILEW